MNLVRNSIWNFAGTAVSAAVMLPAMGFFARQLNVESFGLLALVLAFIGYAGVLDGGIARAVIREIAILEPDAVFASKVVGTAITIVSLIGLCITTIVWISAPGVVNLLQVKDLTAESGFRLAGFIVPVMLLTLVLLAPLEGRAYFGKLNFIRAIGYSLMYGVGALAVAIEPRFEAAVLGLMIGRLLMALYSWRVASKLLNGSLFHFDIIAMRTLYRFGGWITLSNLITALLDYVDRFVVSVIGGATNIAYYAAPADGIQKMQSLPAAVARALFPLLSGREGQNNKETINKALLIQGALGVFVMLLLVIYGNQIVGFWLGPEYIESSSSVIKVMAIGYAFNAIAWVPQTALQAMGHARETAYTSMFQILPYVLLLMALTYTFGIVGTAIAWTINAFVGFALAGYFYLRLEKLMGHL